MKTTETNGIDHALERQLSEALKGQSARSEAKIPERVDKAVLAMAAAKAAQIREAQIRDTHRLRVARVWRWTAAAAALVLVAAGLSLTLLQHKSGNRTQLPGTTAQIHAIGQCDIVDAYILASRLAAGENLPMEYDYNKDGRVDGADVDQLAGRAVSIEPAKAKKEPENG
jgi:hypothetical protein